MHQHRLPLTARHRHIQTIRRQHKPGTAPRINPRRCQRHQHHRSLLTLELIHRAHTHTSTRRIRQTSSNQRLTHTINLRVIRRHHNAILRRQRARLSTSRRNPLTTQQLAHAIHHRLRLLHRTHRTTRMRHRIRHHTRLNTPQGATSRRRRARQCAIIRQPRNPLAQRRIHTPRLTQEIAKTRIQRRRPIRQPAQRRNIHRVRVHTRRHLRQLLRIAQQQHRTRRTSRRHRIRQRELARLINHQNIQRPGRHATLTHVIPHRTAKQQAARTRNQLDQLRIRHLRPRGVRGHRLAAQTHRARNIKTITGTARQHEILNHRMRLSHHAHLRALSHQTRNHMRGEESLTRTRRALNRHIGMVESANRRVHGTHRGQVRAGKINLMR